MAEECLTTLVHHFSESIPRLKDDRNPKIERIIERFADVWPRNNVAFEAVHILVQLFESRVTGENLGKPRSGVFGNLELYASRVGEGRIRLHYKLLELLTETVQLTPEEDQERYLHEIIMMLWSGPAYPKHKSWKDECTTVDVTRAAGREQRETRNYLECPNLLVAILSHLVVKLRDVFGLPGEDRLEYPEGRPKRRDIERLITRIHSNLKRLGIETLGPGPCVPLGPLPMSSRNEDEAAIPSYASLIELICKGVGFIIENIDAFEIQRVLDEDENRHGQRYTFNGNALGFVSDPHKFNLF
jgi:hypothetical protein